MSTVIVDYDSGNLHSALKAFQRMALETDAGEVRVSSDPDSVARASRIVLPGVGAFGSCRRGLENRIGLMEAIEDAVRARGAPYLGICVGMQLLADLGREHGDTPGFGWIPGEVVRIEPSDARCKIPHIGWNELAPERPHSVFEGIAEGAHAFFVHSYKFDAKNSEDVIASTEHGEIIPAAVAKDNVVGTQFHPEKSQRLGLQLIGNFLRWKP